MIDAFLLPFACRNDRASVFPGCKNLAAMVGDWVEVCSDGSHEECGEVRQAWYTLALRVPDGFFNLDALLYPGTHGGGGPSPS